MQEKQRIVTKEERACLDTSTKDANFYLCIQVQAEKRNPKIIWRVRKFGLLPSFTASQSPACVRFIWKHVDLYLLLWHMHHFDTQGTPDGQFAACASPRILNTILFSNPWMGALAFQLISAISVPTDLRIDVIKGSSFLSLPNTSVLWCCQ